MELYAFIANFSDYDGDFQLEDWKFFEVLEKAPTLYNPFNSNLSGFLTDLSVTILKQRIVRFYAESATRFTQNYNFTDILVRISDVYGYIIRFYYNAPSDLISSHDVAKTCAIQAYQRLN